MQRTVSRRTVLSGVAAGGIAALAGCISTELSAEETVRERLDADEVASLSLDATNGLITVRGGDRETVEIRGQKLAGSEDELDDIALDVTRKEGEVVVSADVDRSDELLSLGANKKMNIEVAAPRSLSEVEADSVNGDVRVEDLGSDVDIETTNGDIATQKLQGAVAVDTTNGEVQVGLADSHDVRAETMNGDISLTVPPSIRARFSLETTNGEVAVNDIEGLSVSGESSIEASTGAEDNLVDCESTNGDITVQSY